MYIPHFSLLITHSTNGDKMDNKDFTPSGGVPKWAYPIIALMLFGLTVLTYFDGEEILSILSSLVFVCGGIYLQYKNRLTNFIFLVYWLVLSQSFWLIPAFNGDFYEISENTYLVLICPLMGLGYLWENIFFLIFMFTLFPLAMFVTSVVFLQKKKGKKNEKVTDVS
jgi:hypothetical protein